VSGWSKRNGGIVAGIAVGLALGACGSGARQDANEPSGNFPIDVTAATFPASQRLAQHTQLVITVRNSGSHTIPNIAVTITDPRYGTSVQAFNQYLNMPGLASHSRPVWIVDRAPGPCGYSCASGGPGGAVTAYSNTWALGSLKPGASATFDWHVTAVAPGTHIVRYEVAAGLNGKAKAVSANGTPPSGTFIVVIRRRPAQSHVNNNGQVVTQ
jgi:hypothetical protein